MWHSQLPQWVQNITDPEDLKGVMKGHIDAVMGRYGDRLAHMDVVNERGYLLTNSLPRTYTDKGLSALRQRHLA